MMWADSRGWTAGSVAAGRAALARLAQSGADLLALTPSLQVIPGRPLLQSIAADPRLQRQRCTDTQEEKPGAQAGRLAPIRLADFWLRAMTDSRSSAPSGRLPAIAYVKK